MREDGGWRARWKQAATPGPRVRALLDGLLDTVLPPVNLDRSAGPGGLSTPGWTSITFLEAPVCDGCGAAMAFDTGAADRCMGCLSRPHRFERARAACVYDEHSRGLILAFKHGDRTEHAPLFA
ncbi:MAG TPA: ComF family protein, partial [Caulobacteraceae bacterium]